MSRRVLLVIACVLVMVPAQREIRAGMADLPPRLEDYLVNTVRLAAEDRARLLEGQPVSMLLDADESKEVAVFGATWVNGSIRAYVDLVKDIEHVERGDGFLCTRRISTPPRLEDFADLHLPEGDVADLQTCRVGDCKVKLNEKALERLRAGIDWNAPNHRAAIDALMQQMALRYVTSYVEGGNERLAVYRDSERPTFVASELRSMIDRMPELTSDLPDLRRYLLKYPSVTLPGSTSFLYWQETQFGLKPTIRISHLTIVEDADGAVVASKMLYATHYFWTGLELRAAIRDPARGPGFWLITVSHGRSDGLGGFTGRLVRRRVRSDVQKAALAGLRMTKRLVESESGWPQKGDQ